jgi:hypothetical protein
MSGYYSCQFPKQHASGCHHCTAASGRRKKQNDSILAIRSVNPKSVSYLNHLQLIHHAIIGYHVEMALELSMSSQSNSVSLGKTLSGKPLVAAPFRRRYYRKLGLGTLNFRGDSADEEELLPFVCSAERCVFQPLISPSNYI